MFYMNYEARRRFSVEVHLKDELILTISNGILNLWGTQWDSLRQNNCVRLFFFHQFISFAILVLGGIFFRGEKPLEVTISLSNQELAYFQLNEKCCMQCSLQRLLVCFIIQFLKSKTIFSKTRENSKLWMPTAWNKYSLCFYCIY